MHKAKFSVPEKGVQNKRVHGNTNEDAEAAYKNNGHISIQEDFVFVLHMFVSHL